MVAADISHGERLAAQLKEPNPEVPIPNSLTCSALASFSPSEIDLITPVLQLLDRPVNTADPDTLSCMLKSLKPPLLGSPDPYFSMKFRTSLQQRVATSPTLTAAYTRIIETVIAPHLYNSLTAEEKLLLTSTHPTLPTKRTFQIRYQFPPSLRIHPAGTSKWKRTHRDLEYGHQPGEINFWLPLTPTIDNDAATMHIESTITSDGLSAAYIPIRLHVGEIQRFHGTLLHHKVDPNETAWTRVSLDFRVAPVKCFDASWRLEGLRIVHGYREFELCIE